MKTTNDSKKSGRELNIYDERSMKKASEAKVLESILQKCRKSDNQVKNSKSKDTSGYMGMLFFLSKGQYREYKH